MSTSVSIIITAYNKAPYLRRAVQSALAQTYPNVECLVIDDGSTDYTAEIIQLLRQDYPQVKYFYKENGGISSARNFGAKHATGDWIQFLDGDDWIHPDKTRAQLSHVADPSQEAVVYSDYERVYVDSRLPSERILDRKLCRIGALDQEALLQRLLICPDFLADTPFPLLQQAMLLKRSLLDKHRFDTRLRACEDREFVVELLMQQVPFIYAPITAAYYRKHPHNMTDDATLMLDAYISYFDIVARRYPSLRPWLQPSVHYLLEKSVKRKDYARFSRLLNWVEFPVPTINNRLTVSNRTLLQFIFAVRTLIPNGLLYEDSRGPRSRKLFSILSSLFRSISPTPHSLES